MKAFILAAGYGTRLGPLTLTTPKILVPVLQVPMLLRLVAFLQRSGVTQAALNTHHLAEQVNQTLITLAQQPGALPLMAFHEVEILGTGGGLAHAAAFWQDQALLLWNGDIVAEFNPMDLMADHLASGALATLVLQDRPSNSRLLVDAAGNICGLDSPRRGVHRIVTPQTDPPATYQPLAYNGVAMLSPELLAYLPKEQPSDLIDVLLEAMAAGHTVRGFDMGQGYFGTTGSHKALAALEDNLRQRPVLLAQWTP